MVDVPAADEDEDDALLVLVDSVLLDGMVEVDVEVGTDDEEALVEVDVDAAGEDKLERTVREVLAELVEDDLLDAVLSKLLVAVLKEPLVAVLKDVPEAVVNELLEAVLKEVLKAALNELLELVLLALELPEGELEAESEVEADDVDDAVADEIAKVLEDSTEYGTAEMLELDVEDELSAAVVFVTGPPTVMANKTGSVSTRVPDMLTSSAGVTSSYANAYPIPDASFSCTNLLK